ncbi:Ctk2p [Sugiyamaella lignohabitans]|uniref:Ctk2p n=1 Tax=Sugiyamaella lignohabitans TaxID=796027 RepID=A0A167EH69_9ASCO|nr:Ctk2p [Sugiyamaella lignohabitans]ANB14079.1 Ctk2p [Sugiyamaella lignohabitans]
MHLLQRTMLYNPVSKFPMHETVVACILVSCKAVDTPKRVREIISTAHKLKSNQPGFVPLTPSQVDEIKMSVISLERQILETVGFDFRIRIPHQYIVKLCKTLGVSDIMVGKISWVVATDSFMTDAPMKYPAHTIALSCIILSAKLKELKSIFPIDSDKLLSPRRVVNQCLTDILDFYINYLQTSQLRALSSSPEFNLSLLSVPTFMNIRMAISRELSKIRAPEPDPATFNGLQIRDPKESDIGTVRYVLNWELEHVKGELIS